MSNQIRLTDACHQILTILRSEGPQIPYVLSTKTGRAKLTVYRALRRLAARGLIEKRELGQGPVGRPPCEWSVKSGNNGDV